MNMVRSASIWLLSRDTLRDEKAALDQRKANITYLDWNDVDTPVENPPAVARWMMVPEHMVFQLSFMEELERAGTRVVNTPRAIQTCDKATIVFLWQRHLKPVIDMPPTIMTGNINHATRFIDSHDDAILKPIDGQGGKGVKTLIAGNAGNTAILHDQLAVQGILFVQQRIKTHHEIRTLMVGDEVVAQYARYNEAGLHNLASGGNILPLTDPRVRLSDDHAMMFKKMAKKIKTFTGLDILALDVMIDEAKKPWLLEWNPFFAYGQTKMLGIDIASKIADFTIALSHN